MNKEKKEELEKAELKGVGKILDILWGGSYYEMGEKASKRIETEMIYYFGKNWSRDMYYLIEENKRGKPHCIEPVKTLNQLK